MRHAGARARNALERHINSAVIDCHVRTQDQYGRKVAVCFGPHGDDLNGWMAASGQAVAYTEYSHAYEKAAEEAKKEHKVR
jgi:endonuclease YncB( thermonuclease family)